MTFMRTSGSKKSGQKMMGNGHCKELNAEQINKNKEREKQAKKRGKKKLKIHRETLPFFVRGESPGRATTPSFVLEVAAFVSWP